MNILDIIILIIVGYGIWKGWRSGFIKQVVSLAGFIVGIIFARMLYGTLGEYLAPHFGTSPTIANILAFIILWIAIPLVLSAFATFLTKAIKSVHLGKLNCLGGAAISFIKYFILLSCILNVMAFIHLLDDKKQQDESLFYAPTKAFVGWAFRQFAMSNNPKNSSMASLYSQNGSSAYVE